jgi:hypothetical protein
MPTNSDQAHNKRKPGSCTSDKSHSLIIHTSLFKVKNQTEFEFAEQLRHQRNWWSTPAVSKLLYQQYKLRREMPVVKPDPITFVLISCSKTKLTETAPARELYTGKLFQKAVAWAERQQHPWFIISALHGLVIPNQHLQPYDYSLKMLRIREQESWAQRTIGQVTRYASAGSHAFLIMPELYRRHIETALLRHNISYENPLEGMAIGQQMKWLTSH